MAAHGAGGLPSLEEEKSNERIPTGERSAHSHTSLNAYFGCCFNILFFIFYLKKHRKGKILANSKSKHKRMQHRFRQHAKRRGKKEKVQGTATPANPPEPVKA